MANRRRFLLVIAIVMIGVFVAYRRPWEKAANAPPDAPMPMADPANVGGLLDPAKLVTLRCSMIDGAQATIIISGHSGETFDRLTFRITSNLKPSGVQRVAGPLTIDSVIVDRGGDLKRNEMNVTIPAGQTREVRAKADGTVEIVTP